MDQNLEERDFLFQDAMQHIVTKLSCCKLCLIDEPSIGKS